MTSKPASSNPRKLDQILYIIFPALLAGAMWLFYTQLNLQTYIPLNLFMVVMLVATGGTELLALSQFVTYLFRINPAAATAPVDLKKLEKRMDAFDEGLLKLQVRLSDVVTANALAPPPEPPKPTVPTADPAIEEAKQKAEENIANLNCQVELLKKSNADKDAEAEQLKKDLEASQKNNEVITKKASDLDAKLKKITGVLGETEGIEAPQA